MNSNQKTNESWKAINSTSYEVSNLGRVRNNYNNGTSSVLTPSSNGQKKNDYLFHIIGGKKYYVHQLVLQAFEGDKPDGYECDHKDRNKLNNDISNLRYITIAENRSHKGENHPNCKLNNKKVRAIRLLPFLVEGVTNKKIADMFEVSANTISAVIKRRSWSHI